MIRRLSSLESEIYELKNEIRKGFKSLGSGSEVSSRSPSMSPTRQEGFECGGRGHWRNDCLSKKAENKSSARKVHFDSLQKRFRHKVPHQIYITCRNHKLAMCVKHLISTYPVIDNIDSAYLCMENVPLLPKGVRSL